MFYTTEEAAIVCGFLDLYLNRDSVDRAVREQNRKFQRSAARVNGIPARHTRRPNKNKILFIFVSSSLQADNQSLDTFALPRY